MQTREQQLCRLVDIRHELVELRHEVDQITLGMELVHDQCVVLVALDITRDLVEELETALLD